MTVHELRPTDSVVTATAGSAPAEAPRDSQGLWASVWPRVLAVLVVGSVGLPAAVASYWHLQEVAARFNPGSALAYWLPLSVDGLLAAALVVVWSRRTRGERVGFGPWAAFAFGMIVTLLANAASVVPESEWVRDGSVLASVAAWMVALFPPVAFAVSLELIAIVLRPTRATARRAAQGTVQSDPQSAAPAVVSGAGPHDGTGEGAAAQGPDRSECPAPGPGRGAAARPDRQSEQTAPMPVVVPDPRPIADAAVAAADPGAPATAGTANAPGQTKLGMAEALFIDAWARGDDLSLAEVDRLVDGHRTATKAKRNLRERGILPPSERATTTTSKAAVSARSGLASVSPLPASSTPA
ncbi:DUF2637 domain-containing protein [Pseudonocardia sp. ICBG601]|uniref:DUF2637 domain-containing protein n=1 Tax=Pseudonocardia sp. ICBG601 TaxID=2846759 RepID=UPI001CF68683|nr:DUF2637 domain-containing protein [Pseudonocardia sp. ICBG601]